MDLLGAGISILHFVIDVVVVELRVEEMRSAERSDWVVRGDGLFCGLHALGRSSRNPLFFWSAVGCIALISSPATRLRNSVREQRSCQKV
jgi:hypothetical protein